MEGITKVWRALGDAHLGRVAALVIGIGSLVIGILTFVDAKTNSHDNVRSVAGSICEASKLFELDTDEVVRLDLSSSSLLGGEDLSDSSSKSEVCAEDSITHDEVKIETLSSDGDATNGWVFVGGGMWSLTGYWELATSPRIQMGYSVFTFRKSDKP